MNLIFRMFWTVIVAVWKARTERGQISYPDGVSVLKFRVWPADCDINFHMTHSRYAAFTDIGRIDYAIRAGLGKAIRTEKWAPMVAGFHIEYRREIKPLEPFFMRTRFLGGEDSNMLAEQSFYVVRNGEEVIAARALARVGFYNRKKREFVTIDEIASTIGYYGDTRILGETERTFLKARLTPSKNRPAP